MMTFEETGKMLEELSRWDHSVAAHIGSPLRVGDQCGMLTSEDLGLVPVEWPPSLLGTADTT